MNGHATRHGTDDGNRDHPKAGGRRRLYRSSDDRIISGVAGGIAEYFDIDPVIVRIALVVLTLAGGAGFIGYIAAWVLLPERDGSVAWMGNTPWIDGIRPRGKVDARQLGAIALVGIGVVMLLDRVGIGIDGGIAWPVALIGGGIAVLLGQRNRDGEDGDGSPAGSPGAAARGRSDEGPGNPDGTGSGGGDGGTGGGGGPGRPGPSDFGDGRPGGGLALIPATSTALVVDVAEPTIVAPTGPSSSGWSGTWSEEARADSTASGPSGENASGPGDPGGPSGDPDGTARERRRNERARRRAGRAGRTPFARAALGLFVALAGVVLLAVRLGAFDSSSDRSIDGALALLLVTVGAVLTLGAWLGRPRGFILLGLVTGAVLIGSATLDVSWHGGFGERLVTPTRAVLEPRYRLTAGTLHLDLSDVDMRNQRLRISSEVSLGRLLVEVPTDVKVVVSAKAAAGHTVLFGDEEGGPTIERSVTDAGTNEGAGTLYLDAKVGFGELEVARVGHVTTDGWRDR